MFESKAERASIHERPEAIIALVTELEKQTEYDMHRIRTDAECLERACNGDQGIGVNPTSLSIVDIQPDDVPPKPHNLMGNLALTWVSLLLKNRPSAYCVPAGDSVEEQFAARLGTSIIEYQQNRLDYSNKLHRAVLYGTHHGTVALKVFFDPTEDRVDVKVATVFDYCIDNVEDYEKANWIVFKDYVDKWQAMALYESANIDAEPHEEEYRNAAQERCRGVLKREIWFRPSFRFPTGLYACLVGDRVVESMPFPYVFETPDGKPESFLPVAIFKARNQRGSAYGYTWLRDVLRQQHAINDIGSRQQKSLVQTTAMRLLLPKALSDQIDTENGVIVFDKAQEESVKTVRWVDPAVPSPQLNDQMDRCRAAIYEISGLTASTVGGESFASQSGRAKAFQAELDAQKSADAVKSLESCVLRFWTLVLKLMQNFYTEERTISIAQAEDEAPVSVRFSGVDLQGLTVRLESRSAGDATSSVKQANASTALQQGLIDQEGYGDATDSVSYSLNRSVANDLIGQLLAGQTVEITKETVAPAAFMAAVDAQIIKAKLAKDPDLVARLLQLKTQYQTMIAAPPQSVDGEPASPPQPDSVPGPLQSQAGSVFSPQTKRVN